MRVVFMCVLCVPVMRGSVFVYAFVCLCLFIMGGFVPACVHV